MVTRTPRVRPADSEQPASDTGPNARFMRRALELASEGWGQTSPNPMVGAVLVRNGEIVGEGFHRKFGGDHAEVAAIRAAGAEARDAALYVTLEPCAHSGQTPACTRAILDSGIARVVIAAMDPNPAAGSGAEELRGAGLRVESGVCREDALRLNAAFFWTHLGTGPFVALKLALSADGAIAAFPGERTAITGSEAQAEVHRLRAGFDSVLVGSGTADIDDPLLTARGLITPRISPVRVVLDADLSLSPNGRLAASAGESPVWLIAGPMEDRDQLQRKRAEALQTRGVIMLESHAGEDGRLDPEAVLELLAAQRVRSVLCEGGAKIAEALLDAGLVHRLYLFLTPTLLGREGVRAFGDDGPGANWISSEPRSFGADTLLQLDSEELMTRLGRAA